jgi:polyisoprenyl-phosphate glycosyltransferase
MLLSVVVPVYNEAETLPQMLRRLHAVLEPLAADYEILLVDDGSRDHTREILEQAAREDHRVKFIGFCRNFGHQIALTAGLDFASGEAVIIMDADLQDPPELIAEMLRLYDEGYDVVSPQRIARDGEGFFKRKTASLFYHIMRSSVDSRLPREVGDFRLFSRAALTALGSLREEHRFLRGMVAWLGLRETFLPFHRSKRSAGVTKYTLGKMVGLAWTAMTSFSAFPLRLCFYLGLIMNVAGMVLLFYILWGVYVGRTVQGWASLGVIQVIFSGVILLAVGVLGDYVARVYEQGKARPLYIIERAMNVDLPARGVPRAVFLPPRNNSAEGPV